MITVLDSDDLSPVTTLAGTTAARDVVASPDGKKYYIISARSTDTILVVDVETLTITKRISLGANPRVVEMTPDGRYLLIAAGSLRVIDVETDQEIGSGIAVGQGPTAIAIDSPSAKAYVLADGGDVISVIDLGTLTVEEVLDVSNVTSIALTPNDFRLLALSLNGLRNFRTADLEEISSIDAKSAIVDGEVLPFPNSTQAFARNSSGRSPNTSEIFDLDLRTATIVGDVGAECFVEVMILSNERAVGLFNQTGDVADIDLTASPAVVEIFPFAENTRNITLSPNKQFLYTVSLADASVTKIDLETDTVVASVNVPIAPARHATVFGPSQLPPAQITVNGGDNQFIPPDIVVPVPVSVKVTDQEGSPIAGLPVLFAAESSPVEVLIEPAGSGITNILGVAAAVVTIPPIPPPMEEEEETEGASHPSDELTDLTSTNEGEPVEGTTLAALGTEAEPVEQEVDVIDPIILTARTVGLDPAGDRQVGANVPVEFSGPSFVRLHPLDGSPPGNPVTQVTGADGRAAVRVELPIVAGVGLGPGSANQFSRTISIVATVDNTLSTTFVLGSIGRTPAFVSEGIVNAATFQAGIVPGSLASLFGEGLSEGISETVLAGGATSFQGTTVLIGGIPSPLITITGSPVEQINLQVPFELFTGTTTTIEVENNGTRTTVGGVPVFSTQPGIFEIPDPAGGTVGAVIDALTFATITTDNPAARDRPLSVFFTGGGTLQPTVLTGVLGPVPPAVMTETVVVGVDDKGSEVLFNGYAPGFLGLYQVNFNVPNDAACGVRNLVIRVGGSFSLDSTTVIQCP